MKVFDWVIRKGNSSTSSKRNNDSSASATSKKAKAQPSWVQVPSFSANEKCGRKIRDFQASDKKSITISLPIEDSKEDANKIAERCFSEGNGHSIIAETFPKRGRQPARLKLTKLPTKQAPPSPKEESCKELDKRDDVDAVEQPSNVVQVKSSPQLENKNADSSKKEEIDKLSDFSDEKPSPPRKLSVSSSLSEAAKLQKTDALVEATSASASVSLTSGSGLVEGGAVSISSGSGSSGDISMSSGASSLAKSGSITFSSSAGVAGSTNSGGLTLSSGSTLNGASGAVTISSRSTKLIPCTIRADPQGHAQVKNIVTSMVRGGEHPSVASVVEKYPNIGQKYEKKSLNATIGHYRRLAEKETNDKADLKENESDSDDDDSLEQLIERCSSNGVNLNLTRSVPQQHKVAALKFVQKHGVHKQCMGDLKDALLKEMLLIAEEIGFEMKGVDLNRYIGSRISWARSLSGKPNTLVGPLSVAKREEKRKEDQEALDAYLKECDRELFDERKSEKEMMSIVEEFINSHIEEFGMSFDEAVKTLTLTLYGGITGQLNTGADKEAFRWTYSSNNANPVLVTADGIGIGKKRAEVDSK